MSEPQSIRYFQLMADKARDNVHSYGNYASLPKAEIEAASAAALGTVAARAAEQGVQL